MSGPEFQNQDYSAPDFQFVCQEACAIEDPESIVMLQEGPFKRRTVFEQHRSYIGRQMATDEKMPLADSPAIEDLLLAAQDCARRIKEGSCPMFFLNKGQYAYRLGVMSYDAAARLSNREGE